MVVETAILGVHPYPREYQGLRWVHELRRAETKGGHQAMAIGEVRPLDRPDRALIPTRHP
jgi:hypothetical protein